MFHAFFRITKEEGIRALFNGVSPALLRQATYGSLKLGIYHSLKRILVKDPKDETLFVNGFCGVVAGALGSAVCNPTDVLKIRMQAEYRAGAGSSKTSMLVAFGDMYRQEGIRGLYRGVGPTSQRAAVIAGVELPVYDSAKRFILDKKLMGDHPGTHFVASAIAGLAGAIASNPIDVAKTRMMNQRNLKVKTEGGPVLYRSASHCLVVTFRTEGFFALYRGFIPNFARLCPWNIVFFMAYEQYKIFGSSVLP
ncbi:kidney mitochondrial carrier protein 1 isoform X2 [Nematostella vectensis]|nr:kidney mitochondrial carrier protein 1 isoform X2 [Nematostella vectensis]